MRSLLWSVLLGIQLTLVAVMTRPLLPIDETRYLTVAWEAHVDGNHLVSHLNGETYAHKPPLLFWMINAVWSITGVYSLPARLIAPLTGLCCLPLTMMLARRLWPELGLVAHVSPLVLVSSTLWMIFLPLTMFDTLLTLSALAALLGVLRAANGSFVSGWLLAGAAMGLGILAKGPVILVHVLPAALTAPLWISNNRVNWMRWSAGCGCSILLAAAIGLSWALPAAAAGGEKYASELLYGQTAGRMVQSFAHEQAFWWYLPWLPICITPWILLTPVWTGFRRTTLDRGLKFVLSWAAGSLLILSLVSGKQIHYLLPVIPAISLTISRYIAESAANFSRREFTPLVTGTLVLGLMPLALNHVSIFRDLGLSGIMSSYSSVPLAGCGLLLLAAPARNRRIAVAMVATMSTIFCSLVVWSLCGTLWHGFDLKPLAQFAAASKRPIAWYGEYQGQINFLGRTPHVEEINTDEELIRWTRETPHGALIIRLSTTNQRWSDIMPTLRQIDRAPPDNRQQELLSKHLDSRSDFPLAGSRPTILYVQWIHRGLTRSPYLVITCQNPARPMNP